MNDVLQYLVKLKAGTMAQIATSLTTAGVWPVEVDDPGLCQEDCNVACSSIATRVLAISEHPFLARYAAMMATDAVFFVQQVNCGQ